MKNPQNLSSLTGIRDTGGRGAAEIVQQKFQKGGGVRRAKVFVIVDLALSVQLAYGHSS